MFGGLDSANTKDNTIILGVHGFKPSIPRRNPNNFKLNNSALEKAKQNTGKGVSLDANKPPQARSGFRTPYKPVKNKVFMVRQQALVIVVSGSRSREDDSTSNNPRFNIKSSDQWQSPNYFNLPQKKKNSR